MPVTCLKAVSSRQEQLETLTGVTSNSLGLGLQLRLGLHLRLRNEA